MGYSIADLLKSPDIKGIRLVAGARGVENEISRTNIMDNPDTFDWLIAGEFLLSTGYIFRDDADMQRNIVRRLAEIRCAGLGIKAQRYLREIPACMVEEAEQCGLPLIELPFGHSLSTVTSVINDHLYRQGGDRMERALSVHRELTRAALQSGGLREIARVAVGFLQNPVLIMDSSWRLLAWEDHPGNLHPLGEAIPLKRKAYALPEAFTGSLPNSLDMFRKPVTRRLALPTGQQVLCRVMPVGAHDSGLYGYVVVWETVHTLDAADYVALEQVSISVAMERSRAREMEEIKFRVKRDFFDDLLSGNIESLTAVRSLAELHGLRWGSRYRCILVRHSLGSHEDKLLNQRDFEEKSARSTELCAKAAAEAGLQAITIPHSFQTILLVEHPEGAGAPSLHEFAEELLERLETAFRPGDLLIAVGALSADLTRIADSFADVQKTLRLTREAAGNSRIVFMDDYAVFHLLDKNIDRQQLAAFARRSLGRLLDYDRENDAHLTETLDNYFAHAGNISEAAKHMYIHRNTYIYRLDKIKGILEDDFTSPQKLLEYQTALLAMKITGE